jgi:hypothetical protein
MRTLHCTNTYHSTDSYVHPRQRAQSVLRHCCHVLTCRSGLLHQVASWPSYSLGRTKLCLFYPLFPLRYPLSMRVGVDMRAHVRMHVCVNFDLGRMLNARIMQVTPLAGGYPADIQACPPVCRSSCKSRPGPAGRRVQTLQPMFKLYTISNFFYKHAHTS